MKQKKILFLVFFTFFIQTKENIKQTNFVEKQPRKKALIFGVTGQDGAYLSEFLLKKGYEVHGVKRRTSIINTSRIDHLYEGPEKESRDFILHYGDISSSCNVVKLVQEIKPDEIYNLAAQSHVKVSFELPEFTSNVDALGTLRILEAIRICGLQKKTRFYQASSSEMFGKVQEIPQTEKTPFYPRSPYAVAKLYSYWITVNYRESYGMFATNGILFNHESPTRGETFVTRKIARAVARIHYGLQDALYIGNINASRDWGHARDYVRAMWLILQHETPQDFVISTGHMHTVREYIEKAFLIADIQIAWKGEGLNEVGYDKYTGKELVFIDERYFRPAEVDLLIGDASKAKKLLRWEPNVSFEQLVYDMVYSELEIAKRQAIIVHQ